MISKQNVRCDFSKDLSLSSFEWKGYFTSALCFLKKNRKKARITMYFEAAPKRETFWLGQIDNVTWTTPRICFISCKGLKTKLHKRMRKVETALLESWLYTIKEDTQHVVMFLGQSLQAKDLQSSTLTYDAFKLFPDASLIIDINTLEFRLAFCTLIP